MSPEIVKLSQPERDTLDCWAATRPIEVEESNGVKVGDYVYYNHHEGIVDRFKGGPAGRVHAIRQSASDPTYFSVALIDDGGKLHFARPEMLRVASKSVGGKRLTAKEEKML